MARALGSGQHRGRRIVRTRQGVQFALEYDHLHRLGDIWVNGRPVDCIQVNDYEWETGTLTACSREDVVRSFEEYLADNEAALIENLPYL